MKRKALTVLVLLVVLVVCVADAGQPILQKTYASNTTDITINIGTLLSSVGTGFYVKAVGADLTISAWRADAYVGPAAGLAVSDTITVLAGESTPPEFMRGLTAFDLLFINRTSATQVQVEVY